MTWRSIGSGGTLEIGIALFPDHRGKGVGTEAQRLLVSTCSARRRRTDSRREPRSATSLSSGHWNEWAFAERGCSGACTSEPATGETASCAAYAAAIRSALGPARDGDVVGGNGRHTDGRARLSARPHPTVMGMPPVGVKLAAAADLGSVVSTVQRTRWASRTAKSWSSRVARVKPTQFRPPPPKGT